MTFGIPIIDVEETTGYYNSNLNNKAKKAVELITDGKQNYQYGFVHIKAVDDSGHDKNMSIKVEQIEKVDKAISIVIHELDARSDERNQYLICITGDHSTPIIVGDHTHEPVPIIVSLASNA